MKFLVDMLIHDHWLRIINNYIQSGTASLWLGFWNTIQMLLFCYQCLLLTFLKHELLTSCLKISVIKLCAGTAYAVSLGFYLYPVVRHIFLLPFVGFVFLDMLEATREYPEGILASLIVKIIWGHTVKSWVAPSRKKDTVKLPVWSYAHPALTKRWESGLLY